MRPWAKGHALLLWLLLGGLASTWASFGLTSRDPVRALSPDFEEHIHDIQLRQKVTSADLCNMLALHRRHKRLCRKSRGVAETLVRATRLSARECEHQFQQERWNCTLGKYRTSILEKSVKETSFMYAISSAGLVHEFARACAQGIMDRCTCDESKHLENTKTWLWGGCGDNIRFGLKFTRKFLRRSRRAEKDIRAQVDDHNSGTGIKVVRDLVKTTCKCHGVSGSCTVRTCWLQLSPFQTVGSLLKSRYERSAKVISFPNQATGDQELMKRQRPGQPQQLQRNNPGLGRRGKRPHLYQQLSGEQHAKTRHQEENYYYFRNKGQRKKQRRRNRQKRKRRLQLRGASSSSSSSDGMSVPSLPSSSSSSSSLPYSLPGVSSHFSAAYLDAATSNLYLKQSPPKPEPGAAVDDVRDSDGGEPASREDTHIPSRAALEGPDVNMVLGSLLPLRRSDLAYIEDSPSFCRQGRYSPGTSGRSCIKGSNCDSICCGRGYNVQRRTVVKACRCEVIWCCKVKCKECLESEEIYLCK